MTIWLSLFKEIFVSLSVRGHKGSTLRFFLFACFVLLAEVNSRVLLIGMYECFFLLTQTPDGILSEEKMFSLVNFQS